MPDKKKREIEFQEDEGIKPNANIDIFFFP